MEGKGPSWWWWGGWRGRDHPGGGVEGTILVGRMEVIGRISICELRHVLCKYQSFILQGLAHDWLDVKAIRDATIGSS